MRSSRRSQTADTSESGWRCQWKAAPKFPPTTAMRSLAAARAVGRAAAAARKNLRRESIWQEAAGPPQTTRWPCATGLPPYALHVVLLYRLGDYLFVLLIPV